MGPVFCIQYLRLRHVTIYHRKESGTMNTGRIGFNESIHICWVIHRALDQQILDPYNIHIGNLERMCSGLIQSFNFLSYPSCTGPGCITMNYLNCISCNLLRYASGLTNKILHLLPKNVTPSIDINGKEFICIFSFKGTCWLLCGHSPLPRCIEGTWHVTISVAYTKSRDIETRYWQKGEQSGAVSVYTCIQVGDKKLHNFKMANSSSKKAHKENTLLL